MIWSKAYSIDERARPSTLFRRLRVSLGSSGQRIAKCQQASRRSASTRRPQSRNGIRLAGVRLAPALLYGGGAVKSVTKEACHEQGRAAGEVASGERRREDAVGQAHE